jgi:tetratricopeptide (TPR) repeat protein
MFETAFPSPQIRPPPPPLQSMPSNRIPATQSKTITTNQANCTVIIADATNDVAIKSSLSTEDLETFFAKGLQNSCQATDELIRTIEKSQDEALAREALNLYQNHYNSLKRPWDHETFMYGLGLIYMHFNAYNWAVKSFRDTLYVRPSFPRSRDVHTRLGLIFKSAGRYDLSEKHFKLAINDTRSDSGTSTKSELKFHLAHLSELRGNVEQAIELYEKLLQERDLPPKLSANIHRQLGWIHYTATRKLDAALNHLNTSYGIDSDSQTSYYLGRCLTDVGDFQEAFNFYKSVIDKEESTADTWCSIGVLYQRQNQPWDALQAYIRSVQYEKKHSIAWMNLGILYENHNQFKDALKCYYHVLRSNSSQIDHDSIQNRVNYIQRYINDTETTSNSSKSDTSSDKLLSLEDLWNMESKTNQDNYSSNVSNSNRFCLNRFSLFNDAEHRDSDTAKKIDINLISDDSKPPSSFGRHPSYPPCKKLFPMAPSILLDSKKEISSKRLQDDCQSNPISIVRNIASVLKLDLGLFSTKTLAESNPDQRIDIVSHSSSSNTSNHWICERQLSSSTISRYASYQVASFKQSLQNESKTKIVKSAHMIDLSDDKKWRAQLNELNKLPHFMKCVSASNMLTHIGLAVPGLNTISMNMHVPGCKMVGYKTPNDFCTVNINTGPGDYEWFAIPGEYESVFMKLCNRNGCDMEKRNWWPPVQHPGMQEYGIPVYRFIQRPGDLVWINSSTIYWVQATGWANNIQWNLGPLSAKQYKLASECYELNKFFYKRSEVPLVQMTWNIVINLGFIADEELFSSMTSVLKRSLSYCKLVLDLITKSERSVGLMENELGPKGPKYCSLCECEIFNITFERKYDEAIHCIECTRRTDEAFKDYNIKQAYDLDYLTKLYDTFISTRKRYQEMRKPAN